jgi:CheY-like chemotaxis protein
VVLAIHFTCESIMSEKPTILIADDEPGVVAALAREARRAGLSYITDTTSQQVLELAVRHQPAVIILDLKQHVDGRDLWLPSSATPGPDIKVLVLSAIETSSPATSAWSSGRTTTT